MISRLARALIWEPGALVATLGRNYIDAQRARKYAEVMRAGIDLGRRIEREQIRREQDRG